MRPCCYSTIVITPQRVRQHDTFFVRRFPSLFLPLLDQLVVMPYAALLSREARAAMGVRLDGAVVVVDEAHNIVEAINSVHSKKIVLSEVLTMIRGRLSVDCSRLNKAAEVILAWMFMMPECLFACPFWSVCMSFVCSHVLSVCLPVCLSQHIGRLRKTRNLTLGGILSLNVMFSKVARAHSQLSQYEARYGARLKGSNAFYVGNILRLLRAVLKFLTK